MKDLLTDVNNPDHKEFRKDIRKYNCLLRMVSFGHKTTNLSGRGPYSFVIQGQVYHQTAHQFETDADVRPSYAQLYMMDFDEANDIRAEHHANEGTNPRIFQQIHQWMLDNGNPWVSIYKTMGEKIREERANADRDGINLPVIRMDFKRHDQLLRDQHPRRFNVPLANEVAMIFVDPDGEPPFHRDIRVYAKNPDHSQHQLTYLKITDPKLEPMCYPIFRPYGEEGWRMNWQLEQYDDRARKRVNASKLQYGSAIVQVRPPPHPFNPIIHGGKAFQEWVVDLYAQHQANNLNFIRQNQPKLRVENYQALQHYLSNIDGDGVPAGRPQILPSSFQGSPRNMAEICRDAMAIFAAKGPPDLFITFTANPKWEEIQDSLSPFEEVSDRPDIVDRVFRLKCDALIKDMLENDLLGKVVAWTYTVEFQKRGLPHAHMLFTLREEDKFRTAQRVDEIVSAEIPNIHTHPKLFDIVTSKMIHGPCGALDPNCPCMTPDNKCSKKFPKHYNDSTKLNVQGYPVYMRRNKGPVVIKRSNRQVVVDNSMVVPYNPKLLLRYNAHINVEVCTSLRAVKYIYKYCYKGFDCASIRVGSNEIDNFVNYRYLSAPEACYHLFEFKMHDRSHCVIRLAVHLENQQGVTFQEGEEQNAIDNSGSTLLAWFQLNASDPLARNFLYTEIPHHYIYVTKTRKWQARKRLTLGDKIVVRLYNVSANAGEKYFLRLLMLHVRGARSYAELKTVNGEEKATFREAAVALNLLASDTFAMDFMREANAMNMPKQVREAFAYVLLFHEIEDPRNIWETFKDDLILDIRGDLTDQQKYNQALLHIQSILLEHNKTCSDFQLDEPSGTLDDDGDGVPLQSYIDDANQRIGSLNEQQRVAFYRIVNASTLAAHLTKCFFIDGPGIYTVLSEIKRKTYCTYIIFLLPLGGSGKTYLYQTLISHFKGQGLNVISLATTGIAATLLPGGNTVHGGFKFPMIINEATNCNPNRVQTQLLLESSLIIIDEVSMMSKHMLNSIDRFFRDKLRSSTPFGGKLLVIGGDFRQTLPVVRGGSEVASIEMCIKSSPNWRHFETLSLTQNMRVSEPQQENFINFLLDIGNGTFPSFFNDLIHVPSRYLTTDDLISTIFGDDIVSRASTSVILASTNATIYGINDKIIDKLPGEAREFLSFDEHIVEDDDSRNNRTNYTTEYLNSLTPSGFPRHRLKLKVGCIIMLIRNLNRKKKLCNGTRLIVTQMNAHNIVATKLCDNETVIIPRIKLICEDPSMPFKFSRNQLPIIPAFVMTINKSQGQTFDRVGIMLPEPIFSHGQFYVAISRCRSPSGLKIFIRNDYPQQGNLMNDGRIFTKNIVYRSVINSDRSSVQ
jgi:PIF1-like helicase/Helitron helicase-like domain at N-terminus